MIEYELVSIMVDFEGDVNGSAMCILRWHGYDNSGVYDVIKTISDIKVVGVVDTSVAFDKESGRHTIIMKTIDDFQIVLVLDDIQKKISIIADNSIAKLMLRVVREILRTPVNTSILYRIRKLISSTWIDTTNRVQMKS